jgi:hypothetical protein
MAAYQGRHCAALIGQIAYDIANHTGTIQGVKMQTGRAKHP